MKFEDAKTTEAVFARRTILLGAGAAAGFFVLGARLYQIQVMEAEEFALRSEDNQFNYRLLVPSRGRLLDRFGEALATNNENYAVVMVPENAGDPEAVLDRLMRVAPLTPERKEAVLTEIRRAREFDSVTVLENLSWRDFAQVNLHAPDLPGVVPIVGETRHYPHGEAFAHITGYVGKADPATAGSDPLLRNPNFRVGRDGMEQSLDQELRGQAGWLKVEVDAHNRVVRELPDPATAARAGRDVRLTLDAGLQRDAVRILSQEVAASAAVVDIVTGDILALASYPAFDPNHFAVGMSQREYDGLVADEAQPLYKKAIAGQYPPGSTFKPVVSMAASRFGVIDPAERVYCSGRYRVGNTVRSCWSSHGSVNLHDALKHSCDVYYYEVARRLGIDRLAEVAKEFGIGVAPDINLPGVRAGTVPTEAWKRERFNEPWYPGETVIHGIGQGYITASALQLATMTARVASGRMVLPRLVLTDEAREFAPMNYDAEAFRRVQTGMWAVVHEQGGTARNSLRSVLDTRTEQIAGKSGTSQVRNISAAERARGVISNADLPWNRRDHALFIAYGPFDAPRYAVCAIAEHGTAAGGGSGVTGPMARDILLAAIDRNSGRAPLSPLAALERR